MGSYINLQIPTRRSGLCAFVHLCVLLCICSSYLLYVYQHMSIQSIPEQLHRQHWHLSKCNTSERNKMFCHYSAFNSMFPMEPRNHLFFEESSTTSRNNYFRGEIKERTHCSSVFTFFFSFCIKKQIVKK